MAIGKISGEMLEQNITYPSIFKPNGLLTYRMQEYVKIISTASATILAKVSTNDGTVYYQTADMTSDVAVNVQADGVELFDSIINVNESMTVVFLFTNGSTAYINNAFQIDGIVQTIKWNGGSAPTAGTTNAIDVYSYTIIKTAANTYTVLGSFSSFA